MNIAPRLLSIPQAAAYLGVHAHTMSDYVKLGLVPVVQLPARIEDGGGEGRVRTRRLVDREDLDRFIEARRDGTETGTENPESIGNKRTKMGPKNQSQIARNPYQKGWQMEIRRAV